MPADLQEAGSRAVTQRGAGRDREMPVQPVRVSFCERGSVRGVGASPGQQPIHPGGHSRLGGSVHRRAMQQSLRSAYSASVAVSLAIASSCSMACLAHRAGTPLDIAPARTPADREPELVVGVREPAIRIDETRFEGAPSEPVSSVVEISRASSLIRSMRESGLYRQVDFEGQLGCEPDLLIEVQENPKLESCDADAAMLFLFLGVVPVWYSCDRGHYFRRVDGDPKSFEFPWYATQLFGWFVPLLNIFPSWTLRPPPESERDDVFRAFLLSHQADLLPSPRRDRDSSCSAR